MKMNTTLWEHTRTVGIHYPPLKYIHAPIHSSIHLFICPIIYLSIHHFIPSIHPSICMCIHLYPSVYLSMHQSYPYFEPSIYLSINRHMFRTDSPELSINWSLCHARHRGSCMHILYWYVRFSIIITMLIVIIIIIIMLIVIISITTSSLSSLLTSSSLYSSLPPLSSSSS